jgi:hypothetical protein
MSGNKCYYALGSLQKKRQKTYSLKVHFYKRISRSTVTFGAEAWAVTIKIGRVLKTWR